jgi:multicomponent Na+:H+ antiporter subunit G
MTVADLGWTATFVSLGALFFFAGWLGLVRFPDALSRLHALSKADNVGLGLVVIGLLPQASWPFGVLKLMALWLLGVLVGGATGQMLAGAIHASMRSERWRRLRRRVTRWPATAGQGRALMPDFPLPDPRWADLPAGAGLLVLALWLIPDPARPGRGDRLHRLRPAGGLAWVRLGSWMWRSRRRRSAVA